MIQELSNMPNISKLSTSPGRPPDSRTSILTIMYDILKLSTGPRTPGPSLACAQARNKNNEYF